MYGSQALLIFATHGELERHTGLYIFKNVSNEKVCDIKIASDVGTNFDNPVKGYSKCRLLNK